MKPPAFHYIMFGRDVVLPMDNLLKPHWKYMMEDHHQLIIEQQHRLFSQAKRRIHRAQKKKNEKMNKDKKEVDLGVWDPVYYKII